jgi:hypothetical protein
MMLTIDYEIRHHHSAGYSIDRDSFQGEVTLDQYHKLLGEMVGAGNFKEVIASEKYTSGLGRTKYTDYPSYHLEVLDWKV